MYYSFALRFYVPNFLPRGTEEIIILCLLAKKKLLQLYCQVIQHKYALVDIALESVTEIPTNFCICNIDKILITITTNTEVIAISETSVITKTTVLNKATVIALASSTAEAHKLLILLKFL